MTQTNKEEQWLMEEEDRLNNKKVLISRTRVNEINWKKLKKIATILTSRYKGIVTREKLVELGIDGVVKYWEEKLGLRDERVQ